MIKSISLIMSMVCLLLFPMLLSCTGQNDSVKPEGLKQVSKAQVAEEQSLITFDTLSHNFGTIIEGERVVCYFEYENTGKADLVINSVEAACGCTTPDWSSEPLNPGDRKSLQVIFDASGRSGNQIKVLTVMSNASNSKVSITLKANVETSV